ncbi:MAG: glycosyltransferase family 2 protein [Kofleriaceae bacterium]
MLLSILIPAYQEEATIGEAWRVAAVDRAPRVHQGDRRSCDDGSRDRTHAIAAGGGRRRAQHPVVRHPENRGKAPPSTPPAASGYCLVQDADLEYEVTDYPALLDAACAGADVVYGSRFLANPRPTGMKTANFVANRSCRSAPTCFSTACRSPTRRPASS